MAVSVGNQSFLSPTPGATTYTYSTHSQNSGSGGKMVVFVAGRADLGVTISGVTWNGVSLTQAQQGTVTTGGATTRLGIFYIDSPATGTNNLVVTWSGSQDYGVSIRIYSFTNTTTGGNSRLSTAGSTTPHSPTMNVTANSIVLGLSLSQYTIDNIELSQSTAVTPLNNVTVWLAQCSSGISAALAGGTPMTFESNCTTGQTVALALIEVLDGGSSGSTGNWFLIF